MFRRMAAKLAQNHHETGQYRRLFSVYSGHSANANAFLTFPHAPKRRLERPCDTGSAGFEGIPGGRYYAADSLFGRIAVQRLGRPQPIVRWVGRQFFLHSKMSGFFRACGLIFANECAGDIVWKEWRGCGTSSTLRNSFSSPKPGGTLAPQASQFLAPRYAVIHEKVYRLLFGECPFGRSRSWLVTR